MRKDTDSVADKVADSLIEDLGWGESKIKKKIRAVPGARDGWSDTYYLPPQYCTCDTGNPPCSFCTDRNYCEDCDEATWEEDCELCGKKLIETNEEMIMKINSVGHCEEGTSDKIYIVSIRDNKDGTYSVVKKHGARGRSLKEEVEGSYSSPVIAEGRVDKIFGDKKKKRNKPYVDITSKEYSGDLTLSSPEIEPFLEKDNIKVEKKIEPKKAVVVDSPLSLDKGEIYVECLDNTGISNSYDLEVEYLAERSGDRDFITVYDNFGKASLQDVERFKVL